MFRIGDMVRIAGKTGEVSAVFADSVWVNWQFSESAICNSRFPLEAVESAE